MIFLDTNYLIRALVDGTSEAARVAGWLRDGEHLCTSSIVWYEFLCGPVDEEGVDLARDVISGGILPFDHETSLVAARLYNAAGRARALRVDAMIAASAVHSGAALATGNTSDFSVFRPLGLRLA